MPTFNKLGPYPEFQDLVNKINTIVAELQNLMVSLDTLNIIKLNAKVIEAGTVTAEKMNVTELSAISANLGTITAGTIIGALIETAISGQRLELDVNGLRSYDVNNFKRLSITPSTLREVGMAGFEAFDSSGVYGGVLFGVTGGKMWILGENGLIVSSWFGETVIRDYVNFTAAIITGLDISDITNLQTTLNGKATKSISTSSDSISDSHNHGFTTSDYIQCYDNLGNPTSKKQWVPYGGSAAHSHTQN